MKIFSGKKLLLCAASILAVTLSNTASATTIDGLTGLSKSVTEHGVFYTAHGTTDRKTAKLFKHLMENNRNLQIHAEVGEVSKQPTQAQTQSKKLPVEVLVNYTIHGKTDIETVRKFIKLFKSNEHVEITANISKRSRTNTQMATSNYQQPANSFTSYQPSYDNTGYSNNNYAAAYAPAYAQSYSNQYVWVPVAVAWGIPAYAYHYPQFQNYQPVASVTTDEQLVLAGN